MEDTVEEVKEKVIVGRFVVPGPVGTFGVRPLPDSGTYRYVPCRRGGAFGPWSSIGSRLPLLDLKCIPLYLKTPQFGDSKVLYTKS